jgi:hypothetical protein
VKEERSAISGSDQERWDARWPAEADTHVRGQHPLLVRFISHQAMPGSQSLDVACGVGQNAIGELPRTFSGWEVLEAGDDGGSSRDESWIVCRKPDPQA